MSTVEAPDVELFRGEGRRRRQIKSELVVCSCGCGFEGEAVSFCDGCGRQHIRAECKVQHRR
jgi:hypothetical protein